MLLLFVIFVAITATEGIEVEMGDPTELVLGLSLEWYW